MLHLGKYYPPHRGGMETHLHDLCLGLSALGEVEVEVVVANTLRRTDVERPEGIPVTRALSLGALAGTELCPTLPFLLAGKNYDVAHVQLPNPMGALAYLASPKPAGSKLIVTYQSDIVRQKRLNALYRPLLHAMLTRAAAIVCTSPHYLRSSEPLRPFQGKCRVIPMGIDPGRFEATPNVQARAATWKQRFPGPLLLCAGRLVYYKGFDVAIRALARLPATLCVAGDGPMAKGLARLADEEAPGKVHFLGEVSEADLVALMHACDVFVFPSVARTEAYGLVQLEAMACGKPVVNTSLDTGVPFVSPDGVSGLTAPPGDPVALAEAIGRLLGDLGLRQKLGDNARARVKSDFTIDRMARATAALYRDVLSNGPG